MGRDAEKWVAVLNSIFEKEGFPRAIKSDNGPPFNGSEYSRYCSKRGIQTIFSTPFYPQQNGLVESFIKIVNKAMSAALSEGLGYQKQLQAAVQAYNSADHTSTKLPPEEAMMGRKIRRNLPLLCPGKPDHNDTFLEISDREAKLSSKAREYKRRGARSCKVKPGDTVIVMRQMKPKGEPRFEKNRYLVITEKHGTLSLRDTDSRLIQRQVTQTKKAHSWRSPTRGPSGNTTGGSVAVPSPNNPAIERPTRERRAPQYLDDYARMVQENRDS
ncbi:uncharacterized protein K02A2.6-like [Uranotaenia lowii]|uniref:uncharacterized protein K02A2.6-like n=1 Tax=Uranotaenia lowii TaxID=190385 RepID=UPI002479722B|nr:uncharacterized protein K02A2.6-like [Uranotaenia lowii]